MYGKTNLYLLIKRLFIAFKEVVEIKTYKFDLNNYIYIVNKQIFTMNIPPSYLEKKHPHTLDQHITFDEGPHIYTIDGDSDYMSVTTWNHSHFPKFDADAIIYKMMNSRRWNQSKYFGMTRKEIKQQWEDNKNEASSAGTKMHYDIECFYNNMKVDNDSIEYQYFNKFHQDHKDLKPYRTEWMVYDKDLRLAGSIDMIFENPDGTLRIYDWKRCKEIKKDNKWDNALTPCIAHFPDTNFWHYALQLNTYKYLLEKNYGKKISEMCLVCMHPNNKNESYIKLEVPQLTEEIFHLMKLRASNLKGTKIIYDDKRIQINKLHKKLEKYQSKLAQLHKCIVQIEDELSDLESDSYEEIEVDEKIYKGQTYLVDVETNEIVSDDGKKIGIWVNDKPNLNS